MQKTRLGISVGAAGAILYFLGLFNFLGLILLAGYVLLFESNEWLKRSAVKAVVIVSCFALISVFFNFGDNIFGFFNGLLSWFKIRAILSWPLNLNSIILNATNAIEKLILFTLGFKALSQGSLSVKFFDNIVDKNI